MGLIMALLSPILAISAPFELIFATITDFSMPFAEVVFDWINYFAF